VFTKRSNIARVSARRVALKVGPGAAVLTDEAQASKAATIRRRMQGTPLVDGQTLEQAYEQSIATSLRN
jgi:hypothetical protein